MNINFYRELSDFKGEAYAGVDKINTIKVIPEPHEGLQVRKFVRKDVEIIKGFDIKCKFNQYMFLCKITTKNDNNFHSSGYVDKCFFDYDAAMITLPKAFDFASNVNAACLPNKKIVPSG